jgi:hypothetical protein
MKAIRQPVAGLLLVACGWLASSGCTGSAGAAPDDASVASDRRASGAAVDDGATDAADAGPDAQGPLACSSGQSACSGACVDLMTDSLNCGRCGRDCRGGVCSGGTCGIAPVIVAQGQNRPIGIAVDPTGVYWTNYGNWGDASTGTEGTVMKVALAGGAPVTLATGQSGPAAIAVDSTSVYWSNDPLLFGARGQGAIMKMPLAGGPPVTLQAGVTPSAFAIDSRNLYFDDVVSVPLDGGPPVTLWPPYQSAYGVAVDSTNVYWSVWGFVTGTTSESSLIMKLPLEGGASPTSIATTCFVINGIVVDSTTVYWSTSGGTCGVDGGPFGFQVMKSPLDGGAPLGRCFRRRSCDGATVALERHEGGPVRRGLRLGGRFLSRRVRHGLRERDRRKLRCDR